MSRVISYTWNAAATLPLMADITRVARTPALPIYSAKVIGGEMYLYDVTTSAIETQTVASHSLRDTKFVITLT